MTEPTHPLDTRGRLQMRSLALSRWENEGGASSSRPLSSSTEVATRRRAVRPWDDKSVRKNPADPPTTTDQGTLMKTSVLEVHDLLSVFAVDEVEKRIGEVPGVESVTVNFAAGNATVRFDETRLEAADIKSAVRQRGLEAVAPVDGSPSDAHEGQAAAGAPPATTDPAQAEPPAAPVAEDGPKDEAAPEKKATQEG